jgi:crossover junction endodeoxyribonuclease RuvC
MDELRPSAKKSKPRVARTAAVGIRVLGIDPGTRVTGWGVVETHGPRARRIASGVVRAGDKRALEDRLCAIAEGLTAAIAAHRPHAVAVEDLFHHKNARSALVLGHARGVALLVAAQAGLAVHAYAPALVKRTVAGKGSASKEQVARLVGAILQMETDVPNDETDALAVALTHVQRARMTR